MSDYTKFKQLFLLDETNGVLYWRKTGPGRKANREAGYINKVHNRRLIMVDGKNYQAARIVWLLITGAWPKNEIDHINGNSLDNRPSNLREVTRSENVLNTPVRADSTLGYKGIEKTRQGRYMARLRKKSLGTYDTIEEAIDAYETAVQNSWPAASMGWRGKSRC